MPAGTKMAAIIEAPATPKLMASCWPVAAMVLAPLVCEAETSAYTSVFMLVNCIEVKKPRRRPARTMRQIGVSAPTVANDMMSSPTTMVLKTSTLR